MNEIDLDALQKSIQVRRIRPDDYDRVVEIEELCFPGMTPISSEQLEKKIERFPEGQFGVEYNGRLIALASAMVVDLDEFEDSHTWAEIAGDGSLSNHDPEGDTLYGVEVAVDPSFRGMRIGRRLYDERRRLARELNLKRIVIGGRVPNYHEHSSELSIHEYVERVVAKEIYDPVLTFQLGNGFVLRRVLPNYLDEDSASGGYALLLEWVNLHYSPHPAEKTRSTRPIRVCSVQYQMRRIQSFGDFAEQCAYFVDVASGYNSDFVVFPEIFTLQLLSFLPEARPGVAVRRLAAFTGDYLDLFQRLAIEHAVNVIAGSHYTEEEGDIYNVSYLFHRAGGIDKQYKLHITPNEHRWWGVRPGRALEVFDTDRGKVSIQICYDIEFPEIGRLATARGAQLFFVPFCTDNRQGYLRVRYCAQARAVENQVFVVTSGSTGNLPFVENMDINYAQSAILTPSDFPFARDGIAGECQANIEGVVVADLDLEVLRRSRASGTVRTWSDRRTDLYEIVAKEPAAAPSIVAIEPQGDDAPGSHDRG